MKSETAFPLIRPRWTHGNHENVNKSKGPDKCPGLGKWEGIGTSGKLQCRGFTRPLRAALPGAPGLLGPSEVPLRSCGRDAPPTGPDRTGCRPCQCNLLR